MSVFSDRAWMRIHIGHGHQIVLVYEAVRVDGARRTGRLTSIADQAKGSRCDCEVCTEPFLGVRVGVEGGWVGDNRHDRVVLHVVLLDLVGRRGHGWRRIERKLRISITSRMLGPPRHVCACVYHSGSDINSIP